MLRWEGANVRRVAYRLSFPRACILQRREASDNMAGAPVECEGGVIAYSATAAIVR
jgi:hypothetical protein